MPPGEQRPELRERLPTSTGNSVSRVPALSAAAPKSSTLIMALFYPAGSGT